jgi:hypothetical protein
MKPTAVLLLPVFAAFCSAACPQSEKPKEPKEQPENVTGTNPANLYPVPGSTNAYVHGELTVVFDDAPVLNNGEHIYIYEDGKTDPVDSIRIFTKKTGFTTNRDTEDKGETLTFPGRDPLNVAYQLTRVEGNSLFITPHHGILGYGKTYYVVIPPEAVTAIFYGVPFHGFTGREWSFTTRPAPDLAGLSTITVDGSQDSANTAHFRTVWGALEHIRNAPAGDYTVNIAPGVYHEMFNYNGPAANNITLNGTGIEKYGGDVKLQWMNHEYLNSGTHFRPAFYFNGPNNIVLKNITFKNLDNHSGGQAEALHFGNARGKFRIVYNCGFYGHQDTIQTSGRIWFYRCYVEGDTDFIWGSSDVCLFEECEIVSINHGVGYIFASRTPYIGDDKKASKGYVIFNSDVRSLSNGGPYFGRTQADNPPTRYDQAAIINAVIHGNYNRVLWNVSTTNGILDNGEHAGFKVYNLKTPTGGVFDVSGKAARTSVMTDDLYHREYSDRNAILNRIYVPDTGEYTFADVKWDISGYETEFDASKK